MRLRYWLQIYKTQIKNNFVREAIYRTNFLTALITDLVWISLEFSLFHVIYQHVPTIAGWEKPQTYFFLGVFFLSDAFFVILFQRNFWGFSDLINKGDLDIFLTKPAPTVFLLLSRFMNLSNMFNLVLGFAICKYYQEAAGFLGGMRWFTLAYGLFIGTVTALNLRFLTCVSIFWVNRGWSLTYLYYQSFQMATKPDPIYPQWIRRVITTVLPFAFIGSVPARAVLFGLSWSEHLQIIVVLCSFTALNAFLWHQGLKRYQSASS